MKNRGLLFDNEQTAIECLKNMALSIKKVLSRKCTGISFVDDILLVTKLKSNMKDALMSVSDRLLLRKQTIIKDYKR